MQPIFLQQSLTAVLLLPIQSLRILVLLSSQRLVFGPRRDLVAVEGFSGWKVLSKFLIAQGYILVQTSAPIGTVGAGDDCTHNGTTLPFDKLKMLQISLSQDNSTSPFTEYLQTNYVPSSIDKSQIRQLLQGPEAELSKLNNDIIHLQALLDDMKQRKDILDEVIFEHYRLLTPFRRLPDDMLREIFIWCLPDKHNALMSAAEAPLLLGRVCSRWRSIAYHTPRLWASLHIPIPIPPAHSGSSLWIPPDTFQHLCSVFEEKFQSHSQAVHDWLTRSGTCPLSVSLNPRDTVPTHNHYIRTYLDILLNFSHRWRSLELSIPAGEHSAFLASIPAGTVPMLEYLHLKFHRRSSHETRWTTSGLFTAKNLRVVHLAQFPCRFSSLNGDWSHITHLILSDVASISRNRKLSIEEAYKIFSRCRNLMHCVLDIIDSVDAVCPSPDVISLPNLESLAIFDGSQCLGTLFECIQVPSLRVITYHTTFSPSSTRPSPLLTLLSRTNNHVQVLTTDIQFFTHADLVECLGLMPSLAHLTNKRSRFGVTREQSRLRSNLPVMLKITKAVLDLFLPDHEDQCLCRELQTIDLKDSLLLSDPDALTFIQERMEAADTIAHLTEVNITFLREMVLDIQPLLQKYVNDGLRLNLTYPPARKVSPGNFNPCNGLVKRELGSDVF